MACLFVGDFFLILLGTLPGFSPDQTLVKVGGMAGFLAAYLCLLGAYRRRVGWNRAKWMLLLPVLGALAPVAVVLLPHLDGAMRSWALIVVSLAEPTLRRDTTGNDDAAALVTTGA